MHLTECFAPLIAYLIHFQRTAAANLKPVDQIRSELLALVRQGEELAEEGHLSRDACDTARFALCALADEVILNSSYRHKEAWLKEELQRRFYGTAEAGEQFFRRLAKLPPMESEAREVYYLCLALGFTGRFCGPGGDASLLELRSEELKLLTGSSGNTGVQGRDLFPGGYPQDLPHGGKDTGRISFGSFQTMAVLATPLLLFLILVVAFRFALTSMAEDFLKSVPW